MHIQSFPAVYYIATVCPVMNFFFIVFFVFLGSLGFCRNESNEQYSEENSSEELEFLEHLSSRSQIPVHEVEELPRGSSRSIPQRLAGNGRSRSLIRERCLRSARKIQQSKNVTGLGSITPYVGFLRNHENSFITFYEFLILFSKAYPDLTKTQIQSIWNLEHMNQEHMNCYTVPETDCSRPNCASVSCSYPEHCPFGHSTPPCSCCPTCKRGGGESCGPTTGDCRDGYECSNDVCVRSCREKLFCNGECQEPINCQYGIVKARCKCCRVCAGGPEEKCGELDVPCGQGMTCVGENYHDFPYKSGTCVRDLSPSVVECPYKVSCAAEFCPILNCGSEGYITPPCRCCPVCYKDFGEECGLNVGYCKEEFVCQVSRSTKNSVAVGYCVTQGINKNICGREVFCSLKLYPDPIGCKCGVSRPPCGCVPVCKSCENEECGLNIAKCADGLECFTSGGSFAPGRCIKMPTDLSKTLSCDGVRCISSPSYCQYGRYSCCKNCKLGPGVTCSNGEVPCGDGLACVEERCTWVTTPARNECPTRQQCSNYKCPQLKQCEHGSAVPECSCCSVCKRKPGELCGPKIGVCISYYKCVGQEKKYCVRDFLDCSNRLCPYIACPYGYFTRRGECCPTCRLGLYGKCSSDIMCKDGLRCEHGECRSTLDCSNAVCPYIFCRYGMFTPEGECCSRCQKREYAICFSDIECKDGLKCQDHECRLPVDCFGISCNQIFYSHGSFVPNGQCCLISLLGDNEKCSSDAMCLPLYKCQNGYCSNRFDCPSKPNCKLVNCTNSGYCDVSEYARRPMCSCCNKCRRIAYETCGPDVGYCRNRLECKFDDYAGRVGLCVPKGCEKDACPSIKCSFGTYVPLGECCLTCRTGPLGKCSGDDMCAGIFRCVNGICRKSGN